MTNRTISNERYINEDLGTPDLLIPLPAGQPLQWLSEFIRTFHHLKQAQAL